MKKPKKIDSKLLDQAHDIIVVAHNKLLELDLNEPQILNLFLLYIKLSIKTAKDYGWHNRRYPTKVPEPSL